MIFYLFNQYSIPQSKCVFNSTGESCLCVIIPDCKYICDKEFEKEIAETTKRKRKDRNKMQMTMTMATTTKLNFTLMDFSVCFLSFLLVSLCFSLLASRVYVVPLVPRVRCD